MKVIICGAGQVGYGIAERLSSEGNDVTVVDSSSDLIQRIRDQLDVRGFIGHGSQPDVLSLAGAMDADMLIAVTLYDEVNMAACQVAHSIFNVPTKIARIRTQSYLAPEFGNLFSRDHCPIDVVISPEIEVSEMILRRIALPGALDVVQFADDNVVMLAVECEADCPVINTHLETLSDRFPDLQAVVVGAFRDGKLSVPRSDYELHAGDLIYLIVIKSQVQRTLAIFGHRDDKVSRIVIIGGGSIGTYVAADIENRQPNIRAKIIEASLEKAMQAGDKLKSTVVLHGNALDQNLLLEADIAKTDLVVALTNDDQINILTSIMAKRLGCKSNLALLNNVGYYEFTNTLGIDAHVTPRPLTISKILQHIRRGRVLQVHSVQNGMAEVLEAEALATSPLVGLMIRELDLPDGIRIGAIYRDGEVMNLHARLMIKENDRIIIFAIQERVRQVEQLFRVSLDYF